MSDRFLLGSDFCPSWMDAAAKTGRGLRAKMPAGGGPFKLTVLTSVPWAEVEEFFSLDLPEEFCLWPMLEHFSSVFLQEALATYPLVTVRGPESLDDLRAAFERFMGGARP